MRKTRIYILVLLWMVAMLLAVSSCCTPKALESHNIKDSVTTSIEIKYRDVPVVIPADTAAIQALVKCPENGVVNMPEVVKKSERAIVKAKITDNKLDVSCVCPQLEKMVKAQDKIIKELRNRKEVFTRTVIKEVKYIPVWIQAFAWLGAISIIIYSVLIYLKIK